MTLSIAISILIPLAFMLGIWMLEVYAQSRVRMMALAMAWGVAVFIVASALHDRLLAWNVLNFEQVATLSAPVVEELLKALLIVVLASRLALAYTVDGTAYGFAIGTGFGMAENLDYAISNPDRAVPIALSRVLSVSLMHAYTTGLVGTAAGSSLFLTRRAQLLRVGVGVAVAMFLHAAFNRLVLNTEGLSALVAALIIGLSGTAVIVWLIQRSLALERRSLLAELTEVAGAGEAAATAHPQQIAQILTRYRGAIDRHRADQIRQYVTLQARLGMLLRSAAVNQRSDVSGYLAGEIARAEQQLGALRSSMGLYTLIWLRTVLPSEESRLWARINTRVQTDTPLLALILHLDEQRARLPHSEVEARKALLHPNPLFYELRDNELEDVALLLNQHTFPAGDVVIEPDVPSDKLYIVASGSLVWTAIDDDGVETILTAYVRGDVFGKLGVVDGMPDSTRVSCLEAVTVYSLSRADFVALSYAKPQVSLAMMRELAGEIRNLTLLAMWIRRTHGEGAEPSSAGRR
ncbi:MAG: PrsW family glutamic-type intramembrane protease [Anaerolineae bacterium]|nr:PrsW family glutamic-type intramembrane protease [Anaerolineae bacterium]